MCRDFRDERHGGGAGKKLAESHAVHFHLAVRLGKHLHEVMGWAGPMTHRQMMAWQMWQLLDLNNPDRSDHYLMQVAAEVRRVPSHVWGKESHVQDADLKIKFVEKGQGESKSQLSEEEARKQHAEWAKAAMHARYGLDSQGQVKKVKTVEEAMVEEADKLIERDRLKIAAQPPTEQGALDVSGT